MRISSSTRVVHLIQPDLVEILYFDYVEMNNSAVLNDHHLYLKHFSDKKYKKLIIHGKYGSSTLECRRLMAQLNKQNEKFIIAEAMVVHNEVQKIVIMMYKFFNKSNYPIRIFTKREQALEWLESI